VTGVPSWNFAFLRSLKVTEHAVGRDLPALGQLGLELVDSRSITRPSGSFLLAVGHQPVVDDPATP
jgi:hypothetical protein